MSFLQKQAVSIWQRCLELEPGNAALLVKIHIPWKNKLSPSIRARQILYRFRQELQNPELDIFQIKLHPDYPDDHLWIVNLEELK